ncbi:probable serine/threonine-protein kinase mps1 isoform X1 [Pieris rapae]|uniref:probable serine/threonine-protein kinase mps1 isoform X1 n=1 Tax=Pieris rapae TaxID=64459 RepID=UPI001E27A0E9|nr:probable serine/threonine-protein kinase mps1 isoform X1 [Pieris rapae]
MRLILLLSVILVLSAAQESYTTDGFIDKLNSVEPNPSVRLDPYIRKALLKALSDLEESGSVSDPEPTDASSSSSETLSTSENNFGTRKPKENIQIHSFVVNGQEAFRNNTNASPTLLDNKISILSTTVGNVENYITATLPTQTPFKEIFQAKESGVNVQQIRSLTSKSNFGSSQANKISTSKPRLISTTSTTSTTTTTTTTPKPTHDKDGTNIEEVDKRDVQVYQAPLVAAFTVHQDAHGIPKKVIPIYQQTTNQDALKTLDSNRQQDVSNNNGIPKISQSDYITQQLTLQKQLEEKQRFLEEQLRLLQIQQIQQEQLLRKQQFLLQQKEAQRQQLLQFEQEQYKRQQVEQQNAQQKNVQQLLNPSGIQPPTSQITIQPSVAISQSNALANQALPNKEAIDFLIHLRSQQSEQFPLQNNHLPQGISGFLQPNQNFAQNQNFNQAKQGNRVFRHESGVGNFGINNANYNRFNTFSPVHTNGFFPINQQNQYSPDAELKQLLVQTGLNGRAHEDLNIVTKVLSLNHGVPVNISNRLNFDSRRHVRPFQTQ